MMVLQKWQDFLSSKLCGVDRSTVSQISLDKSEAGDMISPPLQISSSVLLSSPGD